MRFGSWLMRPYTLRERLRIRSLLLRLPDNSPSHEHRRSALRGSLHSEDAIAVQFGTTMMSQTSFMGCFSTRE